MIIERDKENYDDHVKYNWVAEHSDISVIVTDECPQFGEIHCVYNKWNKTAYLESLLDLEDIKAECADLDITYLVALPDNRDKGKWEKFVTAMGFFKVEHDPTCYVMMTRE